MPGTDDTKDDASDDRAARLAAQLRANLRRRKEQARGLAGAPATKSDDVPVKQD